MNKNYGGRWRKLLAEIDLYSSEIRACLYMFSGSKIEVNVSCASTRQEKHFLTSPKGLADAHKWVVETKREMTKHISNPAHQRAETVQKLVGASNELV